MGGEEDDTVWRNGLWVKMWELGVRGKMWIVIKEMYLGYLMGNAFDVQQGVAYHRYCDGVASWSPARVLVHAPPAE